MKHIQDRNFTPRLGQGDLPSLADYSQLTRVHFERAGEVWDQRMNGYQGLLFSDVRDPIAEGLFAPLPNESNNWVWLSNVHRYRNTRTKKVVNDKKFVELRDGFTDAQNIQVESLCLQMVDSDVNLHEWMRRMAVLIRESHLAAWMLGSGGYHTITSDMVDTLTDTLRVQYAYLVGFGDDILKGNRPDANRQLLERLVTTVRGLVNRATMFIESITASAEKARYVSYSPFLYDLPAYPGDGSMICLTNCRCHWRFRLIPGQDSFFHAFWRLLKRDRKNCQTCLQYARQWNPYTIIRF